MKNIKWALAALVLGLSAAGCSVFQGEDGSVFGQLSIVSGYDLYGHTILESSAGSSGLPSSFNLDTKYEYDNGNYDFYYQLDDGYYYMTYYEYVAFTVKANKGALFKDGKDKNFTILLDWYDYDISGLKIVGDNGVSSVQPDGSIVYSSDDLTVTAKVTKVDKVPAGTVPLKVLKK